MPILLPIDIKVVDGVPVGIVGVTLSSTPALVNPAGVQIVDFLDEAQTANFYADLGDKVRTSPSTACRLIQPGATASRPTGSVVAAGRVAASCGTVSMIMLAGAQPAVGPF